MGMSQQVACEELNIHHTMYGVWTKQAEAMQQAKNSKTRSLLKTVSNDSGKRG